MAALGFIRNPSGEKYLTIGISIVDNGNGFGFNSLFEKPKQLIIIAIFFSDIFARKKI